MCWYKSFLSYFNSFDWMCFINDHTEMFSVFSVSKCQKQIQRQHCTFCELQRHFLVFSHAKPKKEMYMQHWLTHRIGVTVTFWRENRTLTHETTWSKRMKKQMHNIIPDFVQQWSKIPMLSPLFHNRIVVPNPQRPNAGYRGSVKIVWTLWRRRMSEDTP